MSYHLTVANAITVAGLFFVGLGCVAWDEGWSAAHRVAALFWLLALVSDVFDGWVARQMGQETRFGARLDRVGDIAVVHVLGITMAAGLWLVIFPFVVWTQILAWHHGVKFSGRALALCSGILLSLWSWAFA